MSADEQRPPAPIQTYVMLDFETTGLFPSDSLNPMNDRLLPASSRCAPQIVELSAVSTSRSQILLGISEMISLSALEDESDESGEKPQQFVIRIPCNVHTRQVKPNLIEKEWNDYETRRNQCQAVRLTRAALEEKNNFADEWKGLQLFLEQMPKPVCIIAHNGISFELFGFLSFLRYTTLLQVYFVDSYLMFLDLEKKHHDDLRSLTQLIDWSKRNVNDFISEDKSDLFCQFAVSSLFAFSSRFSWRNPDTMVFSSAKRRLFDIADDHPLKFMRISKWSPAKKRRVRSNFFSQKPDILRRSDIQTKTRYFISFLCRRLNDGDWVFDGHVSMQYFREKGVFKLEQMYKEVLLFIFLLYVFGMSQKTMAKAAIFLINGPFDAHFAQDDCEALLQVCMAYGQEFIDYVDAKAAPFPFDIVTANNNP
ncbi:unnamed protein product [Toxocara canis]|uniref:Exonuclease domain-containing protein n=1 Tax=Toxocara canis TaxID=6265 RepID=A0A183UT90_TOXCA|nr:unnamed protein product [Toxocara canis]